MKLLMFDYLTDLLPWLFDLYQDGEDEEEQHHPRGHANDCPVSLSDLVKETFTPFLCMIDMVKGAKRNEIRSYLEAMRAHADLLPLIIRTRRTRPGTVQSFH